MAMGFTWYMDGNLDSREITGKSQGFDLSTISHVNIRKILFNYYYICRSL